MQRRIFGLMCVIAVLAAITSLRQGRLAAQSPASATKSPHPLILQENDGEHLLRRPGGPIAAAASVPEFIIKVDEQNGNAEDFLVSTEIMTPGGVIPFHKHLNSEEILVLEEGGATVTVGDLRGVAGPHSVVFIRETRGCRLRTPGRIQSTSTDYSLVKALKTFSVPEAFIRVSH
jgi:mannose-6-phosphate isomerase-like protein (cupin superfamily)